MAKSRTKRTPPTVNNENVGLVGAVGSGLAAGAGGFSFCPVENQSLFCKFMRFIQVIKGILFLILVVIVFVAIFYFVRLWMKKK